MLKRYQPTAGIVVPDVNGRPMSGPTVIDTSNSYYKRRIAAGDIVPVIKAKAKKDADK